MQSRPCLTLSQRALLAEMETAPLTMSVAELTHTPRGRDLQALGQLGLVRLEPGDPPQGDAPVRFSYARADTPRS